MMIDLSFECYIDGDEQIDFVSNQGLVDIEIYNHGEFAIATLTRRQITELRDALLEAYPLDN